MRTNSESKNEIVREDRRKWINQQPPFHFCSLFSCERSSLRFSLKIKAYRRAMLNACPCLPQIVLGRRPDSRLYLQNCLVSGSFGYNPLLIWMLVPDYTGTSNSKSVELASQFISSLAVFSITCRELFSSFVSLPLLQPAMQPKL